MVNAMAVDFGILERTPMIGEQIIAGQQAAQQDAERNMLRRMQMQQMAIQQENMLAQRENMAAQREERAAHAEERRARIAQAQAAEARLAQFGTAWKQLTGRDELTEDDVRQIEGEAFASRDPNAMTLAKGLRADFNTRAESRRVAGLLGSQEMPTGAPAAEGAPAGAAPAPLAVQIGNRTYTQTDAVQFKTDANPQVRALGDYIDKELGRAREQTDPTRRYKAAGNIMFDVQTGQYLPPPALARQAPDVPIKLRPGETLVSRTGEPITAVPPAPPRAAAAGGAAAPKPPAAPKPANVSEQQASTVTQRLLHRAQEISTVLSANKKAEAPTALEAGMENIPLLSRATNLVRSSDRQIVSSAQDDILDALLYLSTGAAYNKEQLAQQKSAYLPSWSDDPPTREVKRQRLIQAIEGARVRAGRAWSPELDAAMQQLVASPVMGRRAGEPQQPTAAPAPARTLTPLDRQALEWANKNASDPRAAEIKRRWGQ